LRLRNGHSIRGGYQAYLQGFLRYPPAIDPGSSTGPYREAGQPITPFRKIEVVMPAGIYAGHLVQGNGGHISPCLCSGKRRYNHCIGKSGCE